MAKKYEPEDIIAILRKVLANPVAARLSGKTVEEINHTFDLLTEPENLTMLTKIANYLDFCPCCGEKINREKEGVCPHCGIPLD